jgi:SecD/SecF fusion protein
MQGNGFKILVTVAFLGLSVWYLFPTVQNHLMQRDLERMPAEERAIFEEANHDRIQNLRERSLSLGLDLQGGMHVTLEIRMDALVRALASELEVDEAFDQAIAEARTRADAGADFIDGFVAAFEEADPNVRLSRYFRAAGDRVTRRSSNSEVASTCTARPMRPSSAPSRSSASASTGLAWQSRPSSDRATRRIVVEMPGIDEPARIRELLRGTARLEFRMMADPNELASARNRIFQYFQDGDPATPAAATPAPAEETGDIAEDAPQDELLARMLPPPTRRRPLRTCSTWMTFSHRTPRSPPSRTRSWRSSSRSLATAPFSASSPSATPRGRTRC